MSRPFRRFLIAITACITASIVLAAVSIVASSVPLFPFIGVNWVLWMVVGLGFRRAKADWISYSESVWWERLTALAMISFGAAGMFALYRGNNLW